MRPLLMLAVALVLAGCGSSSAPPPTVAPTPPGITDPHSHVSTAILRIRPHADHILLYITMHNSSHRTFTPSNGTPFIDEGLVEPNSQGHVGVCSADNSIGPGLQYTSVPAGVTRTGWLRCDYPRTTHVVAVFWLNHDLGNYRVNG